MSAFNLWTSARFAHIFEVKIEAACGLHLAVINPRCAQIVITGMRCNENATTARATATSFCGRTAFFGAAFAETRKETVL